MTIRTQKTVRIRPNAYKIYKYLEYNYLKTHDSYNNLFNDMVEYCLDYVKKNHLYFIVKNYVGRRIVKGFSLKKSTLDNFNTFHRKNIHLQIAEIIEIFIYIYAKNMLSTEEINQLDIDYIEQGITKIYI